MLDLMAIGILVWNLFMTLHAGMHALCYEVYSAAREGLDEVFRWIRPYFRIIEDQFWILIAMGQLVL